MANRKITKELLGRLLVSNIDIPGDAAILNLSVYQNGRISIDTHIPTIDGGYALKTYHITNISHDFRRDDNTIEHDKSRNKKRY